MYYVPYYLQWLEDTFMKYLDDWEDSVQKWKHTKACKNFLYITSYIRQLKDWRFVVSY